MTEKIEMQWKDFMSKLRQYDAPQAARDSAHAIYTKIRYGLIREDSVEIEKIKMDADKWLQSGDIDQLCKVLKGIEDEITTVSRYVAANMLINSIGY